MANGNPLIKDWWRPQFSSSETRVKDNLSQIIQALTEAPPTSIAGADVTAEAARQTSPLLSETDPTVITMRMEEMAAGRPDPVTGLEPLPTKNPVETVGRQIEQFTRTMGTGVKAGYLTHVHALLHPWQTVKALGEGLSSAGYDALFALTEEELNAERRNVARAGGYEALQAFEQSTWYRQAQERLIDPTRRSEARAEVGRLLVAAMVARGVRLAPKRYASQWMDQAERALASGNWSEVATPGPFLKFATALAQAEATSAVPLAALEAAIFMGTDALLAPVHEGQTRLGNVAGAVTTGALLGGTVGTGVDFYRGLRSAARNRYTIQPDVEMPELSRVGSMEQVKLLNRPTPMRMGDYVDVQVALEQPMTRLPPVKVQPKLPAQASGEVRIANAAAAASGLHPDQIASRGGRLSLDMYHPDTGKLLYPKGTAVTETVGNSLAAVGYNGVPTSAGMMNPLARTKWDVAPGYVPDVAELRLSSGEIVSTMHPDFIEKMYKELNRNTPRETVQNSLDAIRDPATGEVKEGGQLFVEFGNDFWRIVDNGIGMSDATLTGAYLDVGDSFKPGQVSSGGMGMAKTGYLGKTREMRVTTAWRNPETGQVEKRALIGDGRGWLRPSEGKPLEVFELPLDDDLAPGPQGGDTGTEQYFRYNEKSDKHPHDWDVNQVNSHVNAIMTRSLLPDGTIVKVEPAIYATSTPVTIKVRKGGPVAEFVDPARAERLGAELEDKVTVSKKPDVGERVVQDWHTAGSKIDIWPSAEMRDYGGAKFTPSMQVHFLNHGLYQFSTSMTGPRHGTAPSELYVDVKALVDTKHPDYPWDAERNKIHDDIRHIVSETVKNYVNINAVKNAVKLKTGLLEAPRTNRGYFVLDLSGEMGKSASAIARQPWVDPAMSESHQLIKTAEEFLNTARKNPLWENQYFPDWSAYQFGGMSITATHLGVSVSRDGMYRIMEEAGLDVPDDIKLKGKEFYHPMIYVNPLIIFHENGAFEALKALGPELFTRRMAGQMANTILHELLHNPGEGYADVLRFKGKNFWELSDLDKIRYEAARKALVHYRQHGVNFSGVMTRMLNQLVEYPDAYREMQGIARRLVEGLLADQEFLATYQALVNGNWSGKNVYEEITGGGSEEGDPGIAGLGSRPRVPKGEAQRRAEASGGRSAGGHDVSEHAPGDAMAGAEGFSTGGRKPIPASRALVPTRPRKSLEARRQDALRRGAFESPGGGAAAAPPSGGEPPVRGLDTPDQPAGGTPRLTGRVLSYEEALKKMREQISVGESQDKLPWWRRYDWYTMLFDDTHPLNRFTEMVLKYRNALIESAQQEYKTTKQGLVPKNYKFGEQKLLTGKTVSIVDNMRIGFRNIPTLEDPGILARLSRGSVGQANAVLEHGPIDWATTQPVGPGLQEILEPVRNGDVSYDELIAFLVTPRTLQLADRGIKTPFDPVAAKVVAENVGWDVINLAFDIWNFQDQVFQYLVDSGMIGGREAFLMRKLNEHYVPFHVFMEKYPLPPDIPQGRPGTQGKRYASLKRPLYPITGGEGKIIDPIESIIKTTYSFMHLAARHAVGNAVATLAESAPGNPLARPVDPPALRVPDEVHKWAEQLRREGWSITPEDERNLSGLFAPDKAMGEGVVWVYRNGRRQYYSVPEDVHRALLSLDREQMPWIAAMLSKPAQWLKAGVTLTPQFMVKNPFKDQFQAAIFSQYGYYPIVDMIRGMFSVIQRDDLYQAFRRAGGEIALVRELGVERDATQRKLEDLLRGDAKLAKTWNLVKHGQVLEMLRIVSEATEEANRAANYGRGLAATGDPRLAAYFSREATLDFARVGTAIRNWNAVTAFLNANLQGWDKMIREFKDPKTGPKAFLKALAYISIPTIALYMYNRKNPYYHELSDARRDFFFNFSLMRFNDATGKYEFSGEFITMPKPHDLGLIFGAAFEHVMRWVDEADEAALEAFANNMLGSTPLSVRPFGEGIRGYIPTAWVPTALNAPLQIFSNRSTFTGEPLVPASLQRLLPEDQYRASTPQTTRWIGKKLGVSPIHVDEVIRSMTGGIGQAVLQSADEILRAFDPENAPPPQKSVFERIPLMGPFASFHLPEPTLSSRSVSRLMDVWDESQAVYNSWHKAVTEGDEDRANTLWDSSQAEIMLYRPLATLVSAMGRLRQTIQYTRDKVDIGKQERDERILEIGRMYRSIAQEGLVMVSEARDAVRKKARGVQVPFPAEPGYWFEAR